MSDIPSLPGLYVHIPFCRSKCPYCAFYSFRAAEETVDAYVGAVINTISRPEQFLPDGIAPPGKFGTVYFGGGTPSLLKGRDIMRILEAADRRFGIAAGAEVTVECNPSSCGDGFFAEISGGVNRVSLGLQSAVDSERRKLGRLAGAEEALTAVNSARRHGIGNISLDLMLGIPRQTMRSLDQSIDFCVDAGAAHISDYMLKIEEGTPFDRRGDTLGLPDDDEVSDMYLHMIRRLADAGYAQYEVSAFSRPGYESRHNLNYWLDGEYLGVGAAAHSFLSGKRFAFAESADDFIAGGRAAVYDEGGGAEEYVMLRLRLARGLDFAGYEERYGCPPGDEFTGKCKKFAAGGFGVLTDGGFRLTPKGFLVSNPLIAELIGALKTS